MSILNFVRLEHAQERVEWSSMLTLMVMCCLMKVQMNRVFFFFLKKKQTGALCDKEINDKKNLKAQHVCICERYRDKIG